MPPNPNNPPEYEYHGRDGQCKLPVHYYRRRYDQGAILDCEKLYHAEYRLREGLSASLGAGRSEWLTAIAVAGRKNMESTEMLVIAELSSCAAFAMLSCIAWSCYQ